MTATHPRAVLVGVQLAGVPDEEHASSLDELERLAGTLGLEVIARVVQRRPALSKASVVGRGKLKEIARYTGGDGVIPSPVPARDVKSHYIHTRVEEDEPEDEAGETEGDEGGAYDGPPATAVLVDHDITPSQARNLQKAVGVEVLDRTSVILAIFERHARTREAKLEVEIARLEYTAPRIREHAAGGDRQRGGIGGRGAGESTMELDRRKVRDRIAELRRELDSIERTARTRRARRAEAPTVALVGYTNAGKSSLMRALTGSEVYVADKLFATLDTTVRILRPETRPRILVSDTVGFIKKLPHGLVASFRATLETAAEAALLLHVVDASDAAFASQIQVTHELLAEIGAADTPTLLLFNKMDLVEEERAVALWRAYPDAVQLSAHDPDDVRGLHGRIQAFFEAGMREEELLIPYDRQALVSEVHEKTRVLAERYEPEGAWLRVKAMPEVLARLTQALSAPAR